MMRRKAWVLAAFGVLAFRAEAADKEFAYCLTCHGSQGNGNPAIKAPKIAAMEPWYVRHQLDAFRSGMRGVHLGDAAGHEMQPVAVRVWNESVVDDVLAFVTALAPIRPKTTVSGDTEKGKVLYAACAECHGSQAQGNEALGAPALAQRTDWYLVTQLKNYAAGKRGADQRDAAGAQMRAIAGTLTDPSAIDNVVAYINTLP